MKRVIIFVILSVTLFIMTSVAQAQEDIDIVLARSAARGFLTTVMRPDLSEARSFYLADSVDISSTLRIIGVVNSFDLKQERWLNDQTTYYVEALVRPGQRTLAIQVVNKDYRWQVSQVEVITTTNRVLTATQSITMTNLAPIKNGLNGLIVFQTYSGGDIYVIQADGTGLRKVTYGIDPELSPDGRQIAFTRWLPEPALFTINIDGTNEQHWATGWRQMKSPSWSADGKRIVFSYQQGGRLEEEQVSYHPLNYLKNGETPPDMPEAGWLRDFEYDAVTGKISYKIAPDAYWHLQQIDLTTKQYISTPTGSLYSYGPSFHPIDPNKIIFRGDKGLGLYNASAMTTQRVSADVGDKAAVISPDGQKIALSFWQTGHWDIHILNIDGTGRQKITGTPPTEILNKQLAKQSVITNSDGYRTLRTTQGTSQPNASWDWNNAAPAWSPDNTQIIFLTDRRGKWEIWLMNVDGSNPHPMFTNGALDNILLRYDGVDERMLSWRKTN